MDTERTMKTERAAEAGAAERAEMRGPVEEEPAANAWTRRSGSKAIPKAAMTTLAGNFRYANLMRSKNEASKQVRRVLWKSLSSAQGVDMDACAVRFVTAPSRRPAGGTTTRMLVGDKSFTVTNGAIMWLGLAVLGEDAKEFLRCMMSGISPRSGVRLKKMQLLDATRATWSCEMVIKKFTRVRTAIGAEGFFSPRGVCDSGAARADYAKHLEQLGAYLIAMHGAATGHACACEPTRKIALHFIKFGASCGTRVVDDAGLTVGSASHARNLQRAAGAYAVFLENNPNAARPLVALFDAALAAAGSRLRVRSAKLACANPRQYVGDVLFEPLEPATPPAAHPGPPAPRAGDLEAAVESLKEELFEERRVSQALEVENTELREQLAKRPPEGADGPPRKRVAREDALASLLAYRDDEWSFFLVAAELRAACERHQRACKACSSVRLAAWKAAAPAEASHAFRYQQTVAFAREITKTCAFPEAAPFLA